jgi:AcrR family transcriptional regulator
VTISVEQDSAGDPKPARMPREQRREQVLDAALEVFVVSGFHSAGMDEIADRAGVSKPILYQHFPSKLDLYLALLDAGIHDLLTLTADAMRSTTDNKARVLATMQAYFAFVEEQGGVYRLVFESDIMNEPEVRRRVDKAHSGIAVLIAEVIAEDTGLSNSQALLLGSGLQGLAQVAATQWLKDSERSISRDEAAGLVASLAWRGISGFPLSHPPE